MATSKYHLRTAVKAVTNTSAKLYASQLKDGRQRCKIYGADLSKYGKAALRRYIKALEGMGFTNVTAAQKRARWTWQVNSVTFYATPPEKLTLVSLFSAVATTKPEKPTSPAKWAGMHPTFVPAAKAIEKMGYEAVYQPKSCTVKMLTSPWLNAIPRSAVFGEAHLPMVAKAMKFAKDN